MGAGISIAGKIESGGVQVGDKVVIMPAAEHGQVRGQFKFIFHEAIQILSFPFLNPATQEYGFNFVINNSTGKKKSTVKTPLKIRYQMELPYCHKNQVVDAKDPKRGSYVSYAQVIGTMISCSVPLTLLLLDSFTRHFLVHFQAHEVFECYHYLLCFMQLID